MPRLTSKLPAYRHHKASGQAAVVLNGQWFYLGPYGTKTSRDQYDRVVGEWLQSGRRLQPVGGASISVVELAARYLKFADAYYRKNGESTRVTPAIKAMIRYLVEWYGDDDAAEFGPLAFKALRQRMIDDGLSRTYINDHGGRLKRMFKWAVGEQLIPEATYRALAAVPGLARGRSEARETDPIEPVEDSIVDATLPHLPAVVADMVRLQRFTGMRPDEVCRVRPCDVDRSGDVWAYKPQRHKTEHHNRSRVVFIGPKAQAVLLRYLARDAEAYCFRPIDSEAKRLAERNAARVTPLSCGNTPGSNRKPKPKRQPGACYSVPSYRRAIQRACDRAFPHPTLEIFKPAELNAYQAEQLQKWRESHRWAPNRLRHSAATEVRKAFGLEAAQVVLGHASAAVTQVYAERDHAKAREVALKIG